MARVTANYLRMHRLSVIIMLCCACGTANNMDAQTPRVGTEKKAVFVTVARLDSVLFRAFNTCDVATFSNFLTDDIEFYHDESGLMVSAKTQSDGLQMRCREQDKNGILR